MLAHDRVAMRPNPRFSMIANKAQKLMMEEAVAALKITSKQRTKQQNRAIQAYLHTWNDFSNFVHSEEEELEICSKLDVQYFQENEIVFKEGDYPDGWYLVLSGSCTVVVNWTDNSFNDKLTSESLQTLRDEFGQLCNFRVLATKMPTQEFGSTALIKDKRRNATIITNEETVLIKCNPNDYRMCVAWYAQLQIMRRADFLESIPALEVMKEEPLCYGRLAENMREIKLKKGERYGVDNCPYHGFLAISSGSVMLEYTIDFDSFDHPESVELMDGFIVDYPSGNRTVKTDCHGEKMIVADPKTAKTYVIVPLVDTVGYEIKMSDLYYLVPMTVRGRLIERILPEVTTRDIAGKFLEKEKNVMWKLYKKKCSKEARDYVKAGKKIGGKLLARSVKISKPIKPIIKNYKTITYRIPGVFSARY